MDEKLNREWRTSRYSGNGGECIEVGTGTCSVLVRDTKDRSGPVLAIDTEAWRKFTRALRQQ